MDPQVIQQLMQVFQQGLQILQAAGGGGGDAAAADDDDMPDAQDGMMDKGMNMKKKMMKMDDSDMDDGMDDDDMDDMGGDMDDDDDDMGMGMGGGQSLHDRVTKLEGHTGLRKSARSLPLIQRIDALEAHWLGEEYDGPAQERVAQLEGVAFKKTATQSRKKQPKAAETVDEAPDVIPLDALIKSAITEGVKQAMKLQKSAVVEVVEDEDGLPDISQMRTAAKRQQPSYGKRKAATTTIRTDAQLVKAAQHQGWDEDSLDKELSFGDALQAIYNSQVHGGTLLGDYDDGED